MGTSGKALLSRAFTRYTAPMSVPEPAAAPLVIHLLGPLEVRVQRAPLPHLRTRKGAWLLALLTLRAARSYRRSSVPAISADDGGTRSGPETSVERTWLAGTLWPDSAPPQAMESLRKCLK